MPMGWLPRLLAATVTGPGACVGSMRYNLPGEVFPAINTLPAPTRAPVANKAFVHARTMAPVLACTCDTPAAAESDVHTYRPSVAQYSGPPPTAIACIALVF